MQFLARIGFGVPVVSVLVVVVIGVCAAEVPDALHECANIHPTTFHSGVANRTAYYRNSHCQLRCAVDDHILSDGSVNEGFACPTDSNGVCHSGECLTVHPKEEDAVRECSNHNHMDLHLANGRGSYFGNNKCYLRCVLNGVVISTHNLHEGLSCPLNLKGVCRHGYCVRDTVSPIGSGTTHKVVVHPSSTTTAHHSAEPHSTTSATTNKHQ